jgi:hypothetical protein
MAVEESLTYNLIKQLQLMELTCNLYIMIVIIGIIVILSS